MLERNIEILYRSFLTEQLWLLRFSIQLYMVDINTTNGVTHDCLDISFTLDTSFAGPLRSKWPLVVATPLSSLFLEFE